MDSISNIHANLIVSNQECQLLQLKKKKKITLIQSFILSKNFCHSIEITFLWISLFFSLLFKPTSEQRSDKSMVGF